MLPRTLALVDDDAAHTEFLSQHLRAQGVEVTVFADSDDLLTHPNAYAFDFYVLDLMLPGVDGLELIRLLRRRSQAGLVVVSGQLAPDVFDRVMTAGADMYLAKPAQFEQVVLAVKAVQRRLVGAVSSVPWRLDRLARQLIAPDSARVDLSPADVAVLECFAQAGGEVVTRETFRSRLGRDADEAATDGLNATIFRLRRRIERATPLAQPLQAKPRVGYVFNGVLAAH